MSIFVLSLGKDVRLSPDEVESLMNQNGFPWSQGTFVFRDMDKFHYENYGNNYISGYQRYNVDRKLMEKEFQDAESNNIPYVVFTNDPIVLHTCRVIVRKAYDKPQNKLKNEYGGWLIITKYNHDGMSLSEWYEFDKHGRLDWPEDEENDMTSPELTVLGELF